MEQEYQKWDNILNILFEYPYKKFTVREMSKMTKLPTSSVQRYLKKLREKNFIDSENSPVINSYYKFRKTYFIIGKMYEIGLIEFLIKEFNPSLLIVFGSVRKGDYDFESDIDIFLETPIKKDISLKKYEKLLKHNIQLFIETDINNLQPTLFNNVINGIKLDGYLKIK